MGGPPDPIRWVYFLLSFSESLKLYFFVVQACDYECDSYFWRTLSVNLNHQMCHHLFPSVHPIHYPAMRRILLPIAAKHGIDYEGRSNLSFWDAAQAYYGWLKKVNNGSAAEKVVSHVSLVKNSAIWFSVLGGLQFACWFSCR